MKLHAEYSNAIARLLLAPLFRDQWVIPEAPPYLERFLKWYEKRMMSIDIEGIRIDRPIFFISLPRCGSSMLQDVLCTHPRAAYITNTMHQFRACFCAAEHFRKRLSIDVKGERFLGDSVEVSAGGPADPVGTWSEWLGQDPFSIEYVNVEFADLLPESVERIHSDIKKMIACFGADGRRFICKTPALLPHMVLLAGLFPDARFIHLVRDARPSANSLLKLYRRCQAQLEAIRARHRGAAGEGRRFIPYPRLPSLEQYIADYGPDDIRTGAHVWDDGIRFVNAHKHRLDSFYEVRYEDILRDPRQEIRRLFDYCELSCNAQDNREFLDGLKGIGVIRHSNRYGNFEIVESICRDTMQQYGYL